MKAELLLGMQKIAKDEKSFMEDMFNGINQHRKIKEELFEGLIAKLGLPIRQTSKSGGAFIFTIYNETISYHHWHGDKPGTLDQATIKAFKEALEKLGISKADVVGTPVLAAAGAGAGPAVK